MPTAAWWLQCTPLIVQAFGGYDKNLGMVMEQGLERVRVILQGSGDDRYIRDGLVARGGNDIGLFLDLAGQCPGIVPDVPACLGKRFALPTQKLSQSLGLSASRGSGGIQRLADPTGAF